MAADINISDIKDAFPEQKSDALWTRFILRPLSFPIACVFIRLGISANIVTYLSVIFVSSGAVLLFTESLLLALIGAFFFNLFALLDCVDGNIARTTDGGNEYGEWVDALGGYISYAFVFLSVGVFVDNTYPATYFGHEIDFVLLGAIAAVFNLLIRIQHQKFVNVTNYTKYRGEKSDEQETLTEFIDKNMGITGILMPVVLLGVVLSLLHATIVFYALFYVGAWFVSTLSTIRTVESK